MSNNHCHVCPVCQDRWCHQDMPLASNAELVQAHTCTRCSQASIYHVEQWYSEGRSRQGEKDQAAQRLRARQEGDMLFPFDRISDAMVLILEG